MLVECRTVPSQEDPMRIELEGVKTVRAAAAGELLTGGLTDINTVAEPEKVKSRSISNTNAGQEFVHELPQHSVSVIRLKTR